MTDPDRGAYTPPTDAPLAFDARPTLTYRRPMPFFLLLGALVLAVVVGAVFFFYRSGVRGSDDAPQPVGTPIGEIMAPAPAEERPADPAAGLEIYKTDQLAEGAPTFAPPPEQPKARPTTPVQTAAIPPVQAAPAPQPLTVSQGATPSTNQQVVVLNPPATPAPKPVATTPKPAAAGSYVVQIGAFSSQALADKGFADATAIAGGGHGKTVQSVESGGSTLYRTSVTGFAGRDAASAYCAKLKAAGKSCFVR